MGRFSRRIPLLYFLYFFGAILTLGFGVMVYVEAAVYPLNFAGAGPSSVEEAERIRAEHRSAQLLLLTGFLAGLMLLGGGVWLTITALKPASGKNQEEHSHPSHQEGHLHADPDQLP